MGLNCQILAKSAHLLIILVTIEKLFDETQWG